METATPIYNVQFHVMQHSSVFINGEDFSSYVNTQNGYISYNAPIQPIGENKIHIVVRSQYYRENEVTITIFRAVQDIPLDLASTLTDRSSNPPMTISATTRAGAQVTILSPYHNMDDSQLASTGAFKFDAVFNRIGTNTVIIRADYPGRTATTVEYDVYYLPDPDHYTPKAWALDEKYGYADLLVVYLHRLHELALDGGEREERQRNLRDLPSLQAHRRGGGHLHRPPRALGHALAACTASTGIDARLPTAVHVRRAERAYADAGQACRALRLIDLGGVQRRGRPQGEGRGCPRFGRQLVIEQIGSHPKDAAPERCRRPHAHRSLNGQVLFDFRLRQDGGRPYRDDVAGDRIGDLQQVPAPFERPGPDEHRPVPLCLAVQQLIPAVCQHLIGQNDDLAALVQHGDGGPQRLRPSAAVRPSAQVEDDRSCRQGPEEVAKRFRGRSGR